MLKANICWWKNILVFMEEYFGFWSNKTIAISYPVNLNQDLTKCKHKKLLTCVQLMYPLKGTLTANTD